MRYWMFFGAKLVAAAVLLTGLWWLLAWVFPERDTSFYRYTTRMGYDLRWTLLIGAVFLAGCGLGSLAVIDQRYRCRTCLRRLRMPLDRGSWSDMLALGDPRIEYICPFGHGTLKVPQAHVSVAAPTTWEEHEDIWRELYELESADRRR